MLTERLAAAPPLLAHVVGRCLSKEPRNATSPSPTFGPSSRPSPGTTTAVTRRAPRAQRRAIAAAPVLALAVRRLVSGRWPDSLSFSQNALAFQSRDWILLADFENLTQEPVFDRSLKTRDGGRASRNHSS